MMLTILITLIVLVGLVIFFTFREEKPLRRTTHDLCNPGICRIMPDGRRQCFGKRVCSHRFSSKFKKI